MASSKFKQRAVTAGLSCGVGIAAPALAYAVTIPLGPAHDFVASGAFPFAVGAIAGVGVYAASLGIADHRFETRALDAEDSRVFGGAQPTTQFKMNERFQQAAQQGAGYPQTRVRDSRVWDRPVEVLDDRPAAGLSGVFQRRRSLDDVPTISRAAGAPSEDEAWAMIDGMLDEDSPVSCDPARSRDVYEVAIDELKGAAAETGTLNREDIAAAARAVAGSRVAPAGTTAQFVSLVANANATATGPSQGQAATWAQPSAATNPYASSQASDDPEGAAAREAAVNSLWGTPAATTSRSVDDAVPYNDALASLPVINAAGAGAPVFPNDTFVATMKANVSQPMAADDSQTDMLEDVSAPVEPDIPMADYSGHEDMWAAALAVLDEPAPQAAPAVNTVESAPAIDPDPAYVGTHSRVLPEDTARMSRRGIERAEAIAEGVLANRRHARVNEILEEEIDRIDSRSVRRTGHEYLSVIEGGTSSFPSLQAEA